MIYVVMGVTGAGKTTVGELLARRLGLPFQDGDNYHPPSNREKLSKDIPLDDEDRLPWLELLSKMMAEWNDEGGAVVACSALKESYRAVLRRCVPDTVFVYLEGDKEMIARRLEERALRGHRLVKDFRRILDGQFRDLEEPADAVTVSVGFPPDKIVDEICAQLRDTHQRTKK